jgi:DNA ligase-1
MDALIVQKFPTLYKKASTGKVHTWYMEVDGDRYRTVSGSQDGKKVTSAWKVAKAKNVGASNATTPEEQALAECNSAYKKKLAQGGYSEDPDNLGATYFKPMLATEWTKVPLPFDPDFEFFVYAQPKLDGVRCIATKDGLWSRQGKPLIATPHIAEALAPFFREDPDLILDGELYADKLNDNFNKIISLVRKQNPTKAQLEESARTIEYHIYDIPSVDGGFAERADELVFIPSRLRFANGGERITCIRFVETMQVNSREGLDDLFGEWVGRGYEGQIIRLADTPYENKRSKSLLKRKDFKDQEFEIVSVDEGVGNRSGMAGFITYRLPNGNEFGSGIKGSHEYCKELLRDAEKYRGGTGTVRFFDWTPDGYPRFPVTVALYPEGRDT